MPQMVRPGRKVMIRPQLSHPLLQHRHKIPQLLSVLAKLAQQLSALLTHMQLCVRRCYWTRRSVFFSCWYLRSFVGVSSRMAL